MSPKRFIFSILWFLSVRVQVVIAIPASCSDTRRRLLSTTDDGVGNTTSLLSWQAHKERCAEVDYYLALHVNLDSHVEMIATPVHTKVDGSAQSSQVDGDSCFSVVLQDLIMLHGTSRGKDAKILDSQAEVDKMFAESLVLERLGDSKTYKWFHIARAFEMARWGQEGAYDILRNCCASFVVDMMSYSGAPADVNALVDYFVHRWVREGEGELLDRDYLFDLIPQARFLRGLIGNSISDETLVSWIVQYYVWEYYNPDKAKLTPGSYHEFGSGNDPMEFFCPPRRGCLRKVRQLRICGLARWRQPARPLD